MIRAVIICCGLLALVRPSAAQSIASRIEVTAGGGLLGGANLGSDDANLRANDPGRRPFRLFSADSRIARGPALHLRVLVPVNGRVAVEGGLTVSHPDLRTSIGMDAEGAPPADVAERLDQYIVDGSLLVMLDGLRMGNALPFVAVGGGYLRQLHEGQMVIEHGQAYYAGGGVRYPILQRSQGFVRAAGLRADVRAVMLRGGVALDNRPRPHAAISGGAFIGF